jgi:hypothetical protein
MAATIENLLAEKGHDSIEVKPETPVIEDCFLALMEKTFENEIS